MVYENLQKSGAQTQTTYSRDLCHEASLSIGFKDGFLGYELGRSPLQQPLPQRTASVLQEALIQRMTDY